MFNSLRKWFDNHFSHPDAIVIVILITVIAIIILFFGEMLAPLIAASIIAYMLEGFVQFLIKKNIPRIIAVYVSFFCFFIGLMMFLFLGLAPVVSNQIGKFLEDLPKLVVKAGVLLENLPKLLLVNYMRLKVSLRELWVSLQLWVRHYCLFQFHRFRQ